MKPYSKKKQEIRENFPLPSSKWACEALPLWHRPTGSDLALTAHLSGVAVVTFLHTGIGTSGLKRNKKIPPERSKICALNHAFR